MCQFGTAAGLEEQLGKFADSDILRAILDQGCNPGEYERQYETSLREAERCSVQDYIAESENLVSLHNQATNSLFPLPHYPSFLPLTHMHLGNVQIHKSRVL